VILGWLAIALYTQPAAAAITRQPYLQALGPTSVVIMWQTDAAPTASSQVHFGTQLAYRPLVATGSATQSTTEPTPWNHAVVLSGLSPSTRYYYDVGTLDGIEAGGTSNTYFETAPLPSDTRPFSFWVVGDSGTNGDDQHAVRDAMMSATAANPPDLMLQVGDMAYDTGSNANFTLELFGVYTATLRHTPFWPAIGNHEGSEYDTSDSPTQSGPYYEAFTLPSAGQIGGVASGTEAYYSFDYGSVHFIALDSDDSSTEVGSPQLIWLAADLAGLSATRQWVIAWFHHPPYTKGTHDSDRAGDSGARMVRMRENVLPILEAGGVDLVLAGHSHGYERSRLISGVYGFGSSPNYVTPDLAMLTTAGKIIDAGDGNPSGDGAYHKPAGVQANSGTVYVVAGHGGNTLGGDFGHPVMRFSERRFGSCLVNVNHAQLSLRNIRSDGSVADSFSIVKPCSVASDCDDDDPCTENRCAAATSTCLALPIACHADADADAGDAEDDAGHDAGHDAGGAHEPHEPAEKPDEDKSGISHTTMDASRPLAADDGGHARDASVHDRDARVPEPALDAATRARTGAHTSARDARGVAYAGGCSCRIADARGLGAARGALAFLVLAALIARRSVRRRR
jgi:MYXO-CTERM domain-containing protein